MQGRRETDLKTYLCCPDMIWEVLVVCGWPGEDEEHSVSHQGHAVLNTGYDLLPHPLGYQVVPQHYDCWPSYKPKGVETEEGVVESTLKQHRHIEFISSSSSDLFCMYKVYSFANFEILNNLRSQYG